MSKLSIKRIRSSTLLAGFILHVIVATQHTYSNITRYYHSYLTELNSINIKFETIEIIFSVVTAVNSICIPIGVLLNGYFNTVTITVVGLMLNLFSNSVMIYCPQINLVIISLILGSIGCGLVYMPIIIEIWQYYPRDMGVATSIAFSGFCLTRLLFKYISVFLINPNKVSFISKEELYPSEINDRFKSYLKKSLIFFSVLSVLCVYCIYPYSIYIYSDSKNVPFVLEYHNKKIKFKATK